MIQISVVIPVKDEAGNAAPLAREIGDAMQATPFAGSYEIVFVDDGSTDGTVAELLALRPELPTLRIVSHPASFGQSRAIHTGVKAARGTLIVTLDGDGQNDPAEIPKLLGLFEETPELGMAAGERMARKDKWSKRAASGAANRLRRWALSDNAKDVGCGLKAFRRDVFLALPYFDNMHRYLIALVQREGHDVRFVPVGHRPRLSGRSKYGNWDRFLVGISDLFGVMWLKRRHRGRVEPKEH